MTSRWPQDTNQWGQDRRDGRNLATLLRELATIPGLRWIRLLYCYPSYFTDELIDEIATNPKARGTRGALGRQSGRSAGGPRLARAPLLSRLW